MEILFITMTIHFSYRLLVSLGTSFIEVPYDIPWRFFGKELSYDFSVGGLVDSDTVTFKGGISTLIINDRYEKFLLC